MAPRSSSQRQSPFQKRQQPVSSHLEHGWLTDSLTSASTVDETSKPPRSWDRLTRTLRSRWQADNTPQPTLHPVGDSRMHHPLERTEVLQGLSTQETEYLTTLFMAATPQSEWGSRQAAMTHLESLLPVWGVRDWQAIHGLHVIVGSSGSGKTTLTLKLALAVQNAGKRVAVLGLYPEQTLQRAAFKETAKSLKLSAAIIDTQDSWRRALFTFRDCEAILVDTPCLLSDPGVARRLQCLPELRNPNTVIHHNICLHHGGAFLQREIDLVTHLAVDQIAISKADLAPGLGSLLSLQMKQRHTISLLNDSPYLDHALQPTATSSLFASLAPRDD